jgi:oligosaccharide translocation protein RFT1
MSAENSNIVGKGVSGIRALVGLQLISRGLTFGLNILITKKLPQSIIGVSNVQLQLLLNTILFLSREAFRRACGRSSDQGNIKQSEIARVLNVAWLSVPLGAIVSTVVCYMFFLTATQEEKSTEDYFSTVVLTCIATFLEVLSEPGYILAQNSMLFSVRVRVEASAIFLKCITTFILVYTFNMSLISFGYAQVIYSLTLIVGYYGYFVLEIWSGKNKELTSVKQLLPALSGNNRGPIFDPKLIGLSLSFLWQSFQKLILQEAEKVILKSVTSLVNQGIFGVVNFFGSLVARFLFQPIEEVCFQVFGKLLSSTDNEEKPTGVISKKDESIAQKEVRNNVFKAQILFRTLFKVVIYVGIYFVAFGPNYSFILLHLLYGSTYSYSAATTVLSWYCLYVLFMGVNGITEAFAHAVADKKQIQRFNFLMLLFSIVYVSASISLIKYMETSGLVVANCINMGMRIIFSVKFIRAFFAKHQVTLSDLLPPTSVLITFTLASIVTYFSEQQLCNQNQASPSLYKCSSHIGIGAVNFLFTIGAVYKLERAFLRDLTHLWRNKDVKLD